MSTWNTFVLELKFQFFHLPARGACSFPIRSRELTELKMQSRPTACGSTNRVVLNIGNFFLFSWLLFFCVFLPILPPRIFRNFKNETQHFRLRYSLPPFSSFFSSSSDIISACYRQNGKKRGKKYLERYETEKVDLRTTLGCLRKTNFFSIFVSLFAQSNQFYRQSTFSFFFQQILARSRILGARNEIWRGILIVLTKVRNTFVAGQYYPTCTRCFAITNQLNGSLQFYGSQGHSERGCFLPVFFSFLFPLFSPFPDNTLRSYRKNRKKL